MSGISRSQLLGNVHRAVVKVGSSVLAEQPVARIRTLAADVAQLRQGGIEIILVTRGSIRFGMERLALKRLPRQVPLLQAASTVGQVALMQTYEDAMRAHGIETAQVLISPEDLTSRERFLRARHTVMALLDYGVVPVISENDAVAVSEIVDGENDMLAARILQLVEADLLVLLTAAEGIYATSPRKGGGVVSVVQDIEAVAQRINQLVGPQLAQRSLASKVRAAQAAAAQGVPTVVASGVRAGVLGNVLDDETIGTLMLPTMLRRSRKKWIAEDLEPQGELQVSAEVRRALVEGNRSLLASSVERSEGTFRQGDAVRVKDAAGEEFARGLVGYSCTDLDRIQGKGPDDIEDVLGYRYYEEVIRRDDLVIL